MSHADFFQALVHTRAGLPRDREHASVNFGALRAGAAQGFAPRGQGERRLRRGDPDVSFFERHLVEIRLEESRAAEIRHRFGSRQPRANFAESPQKIELPPKRRPLEGPRRALNCFGEVAAAVGRGGEPHFVLDPDSARQRLLVSRSENPRDSRGQKHDSNKAKNPGDHATGAQLRRPAQRQTKKENPGEGRADAMSARRPRPHGEQREARRSKPPPESVDSFPPAKGKRAR